MNWKLFVLVIVVVGVMRVVPILNNNFYFTVDQGRDAVYVREILESKKIFWKGPETTKKGIFTGPGWYYFLAVGYLLTDGHPVGGVMMMIVLALVTLGLVIRKTESWIVGLGLALFWPFYEVSRYAFNPFPLVFLAFWLVWGGGLVPVILAFNTHLVGGVAFLIYWVINKLTKVKSFLILVGATLVVVVGGGVWRDWYVLYLLPVVYVFGIWFLVKRKLWVLVGIVFVVQIIWFGWRYAKELVRSDDPGILGNQMKVMDWIYKNSEGDGFSVYVYTDRFSDFNYQYLWWWYGKETYGFMPCEYSNFPESDKSLYVPGFEKYVEPKKGCDRLRFLIVESETNGEENRDWILVYRGLTKLVDSVQIGKVRIEKREATRELKEYYDPERVIYREYVDENLRIKFPEYWEVGKRIKIKGCEVEFEAPPELTEIILKSKRCR